MTDKSEELIDHYLGMFISNILYKEGITSTTIKNFSVEDIQEILRNPEKTRFWRTGGIRIITWESFLSLAQAILENNYMPKQEKDVNAVGSIVIAYMALEERVNSFLQDCLLLRGDSLKEISEKLDRSLPDKLDRYLHEITKHSLKIEKPELWGILIKAKNVRHPKVHNKTIPTILGEEQYKRIGNPPYSKIASSFLKAVHAINEYLESCYPEEFWDFNNELSEIWEKVKVKLGMRPGYTKGFAEVVRLLQQSKNVTKPKGKKNLRFKL